MSAKMPLKSVLFRMDIDGRVKPAGAPSGDTEANQYAKNEVNNFLVRCK